ncbi:MAG: adenylate/guanylate cyclase domain-containing protein [Acidimicrobiia bacterium]|nr:adenylate/guanylate cyclase domain-containing protein [Acidimicrobiia bacterium]
MARKRKKTDAASSLGDLRSGKMKPGDIAANVKQMIAAKIAEKYAEDPNKFAPLLEVGLVDEATLRTLPEGTNFDTALRQFRDRLAAIASDEPSVLERLQVRPLEVLAEDAPTGETLPAISRAVVFSDLEGFTEYTSEKGDREASAMLRDHYDTVDSIVRGRGGTVVKTIGDGHMLSFAEPRAAVLAEVELAALSAGPLHVRVGGHEGSVLATDNDLLGHVVNVAARVTDTADGGQALVTDRLRQAAGRVRGVEFELLSPRHLKGLAEQYEISRAFFA